jgi:hypothetical protein
MVPDLRASWTSPLDEQDKSHRLTTTMTACASFTRVAWFYTVDDSNVNGQRNAQGSNPSGGTLSTPIPASGVIYLNQDGSLNWEARLYIQFVGVGTGQVQLQYTVQNAGAPNDFTVLTPTVTPQVSRQDQCPAGLLPIGRCVHLPWCRVGRAAEHDVQVSEAKALQQERSRSLDCWNPATSPEAG